ncbi:MAG TPA: FkbM family methyltransferase [Tepidisphaeraceae bacterium]|nr:FkbM family methyltransferase [Tepidisphaeraceae bacterium]
MSTTVARAPAPAAEALPPLPAAARQRRQDKALAPLRRRLWNKPPGAVVKLGDHRVRITDGPNAYMQYKDVFVRGVYQFTADRPDPLVIDGGGNMGISALGFKHQHPAARVISFEPDPAIAKLMRENLARNNVTGVTIVEAGLAEAPGTVSFAADGSAGGRFGDAGASVNVVRLSDHLGDEPVDFVKLNIEGQELPVLRDLERTGKINLVRRIVLEYHGWARGAQRLAEILSLLDRSGFRYLVHDFDGETCGVTKPPFRHRPKADWFCLVYAERVGDVPKRTPVDLGALRTAGPVSRVFGTDRGTPLDRYYIERFLARCSADVHGRVMEVGDPTYTRRFGGDRVAQADVLHATPGNRKATIVGDLATGTGIPGAAFDCVILTQVLPFLFDVRAAVATLHRALKPGGVALVTVPCISQISRYDMDRWGDFWRFTTLSAKRLFEEAFAGGTVDVQTRGNALAATAFVQGMALEDLTPAELDPVDEDYQVIITVRAVKAP